MAIYNRGFSWQSLDYKIYYIFFLRQNQEQPGIIQIYYGITIKVCICDSNDEKQPRAHPTLSGRWKKNNPRAIVFKNSTADKVKFKRVLNTWWQHELRCSPKSHCASCLSSLPFLPFLSLTISTCWSFRYRVPLHPKCSQCFSSNVLISKNILWKFGGGKKKKSRKENPATFLDQYKKLQKSFPVLKLACF